MPAILAAGGGFLLGVLWMDLLFDVQALGVPDDAAIASISAYYRRATTEAYPLNRLIAAVMLLTLGGALYRAVRGGPPRAAAALAVVLVALPVGLALWRVVPNAVRLGSGADPIAVQRELARTIGCDHVLCAALIAGFIGVQVAAGHGAGPARSGSPPAVDVGRAGGTPPVQ